MKASLIGDFEFFAAGSEADREVGVREAEPLVGSKERGRNGGIEKLFEPDADSIFFGDIE